MDSNRSAVQFSVSNTHWIISGKPQNFKDLNFFLLQYKKDTVLNIEVKTEVGIL